MRVAARSASTANGYLTPFLKEVYPQWWGAQGNGAADDTAAIQAAIDSLPYTGGVIFFPNGTYRLTAPLVIADDLEHNYRHSIRLTGAGGGASGGAEAPTLEWDGATTEPILKLHSRDCLVSHLTFRVAAGKRTVAAIDIDKAQGTKPAASTNNIIEHVRINGGGERMIDGVRIGLTAPGNADLMYFRKVYIEYMAQACVNVPSTTGQVKHVTFDNCAFSFSPYGIKTRTGSFQTLSCSFNNLTTAIALGAITDHIFILSSDAEECAQFLATGGGSSGSWPVTITGGRFSLQKLTASGRYIEFTDGGPLTVQGAIFEPNYNRNFKIYATPAPPGAVLIALGNRFPNETPFAGEMQRRLALGNRGQNSSNAPVHLPDEIISLGGAGGSLSLGSPIYNVTTVSSGTSYAATTSNYIIIVNKPSGSATAITLPAQPVIGQVIIVKDGKGDAATNPITVSSASGAIDGAAKYMLRTNYQAAQFVYHGLGWAVF